MQSKIALKSKYSMTQNVFLIVQKNTQNATDYIHYIFEVTLDILQSNIENY